MHEGVCTCPICCPDKWALNAAMSAPAAKEPWVRSCMRIDKLTAEKAVLTSEVNEQARLLGISGSREAKLLAENAAQLRLLRELHEHMSRRGFYIGSQLSIEVDALLASKAGV